MMQKAVCALSGVVVLCLAAIVCLFVVMHHNANIVSNHHDMPVPPTEPTRKNVSTKPQHARTVTPRLTYGPVNATTAPKVDHFATLGCDVTSFPGLSASSVKVQHSRTQKRLDCKFSINMSPEEFYIKTNKNQFVVDIRPGDDTIISQECQYKTNSCGPSNNVFVLPNNNLNDTHALIKGASSHTPSKQKKGSQQQYSYLLVSGVSKIVAKVRLLPSRVACLDCCHVSQGTFLDIHYTFSFDCPTYNNDYKINPNT